MIRFLPIGSELKLRISDALERCEYRCADHSVGYSGGGIRW
jgi:hypothetical protein